jgi:hypothetical protein
MSCCDDQILREDQLCSRHCVEGQSRLARLGEETKTALRGSNQAPAEAPLSVERPNELYLGLETPKAIKVLCTNQRAVDAWGADLKRVGTADRVSGVEEGRDGVTNLCAIIVSDWEIIEPFSHYL